MIKKILFADMIAAPNWQELEDGYAIECRTEGFPKPTPNVELYTRLEAIGTLTFFGAFEDGVLMGFISVICTPAAHYDITLCTTESFFVLEKYRNKGAGLKLLREAEKFAKEKQAAGLLVSAKSGGRLAEVLEKMDYKENNRVFFKECA